MPIIKSEAGAWYDGDNPFVSIIVLNFNNAEMTIKCLEAIWAYTIGYRYEVLVVDNGSASHDVSILRAAGPHLHLIELAQNSYFGVANNLACQRAKGEVLVFLNNDAFVTAGWLPPLINTLHKGFRAGGVGPKLINTDGTLQEAGAFIDSQGDPIQIGRVPPYHPDEETVTKIVDYCSAACFVIRRRLFLDLGAFDEAFYPAYYEDVDLCFRIAKAGLYTYYCPASVVTHVRSVTTDRIWTRAQLHDISARNRQIFVERWGSYLRAREALMPGD